MCTVVLHGRAKYQWLSLLGADEASAVFIRGTPADGPQVETVFGSPILPGLLDNNSDWAKFKLSPPSLLSWQATFQSLIQQGATTFANLSVRADLFADTKNKVKFEFTPCKRAADKTPDEFNQQAYKV
ncbi:hypothetical protein ACA910_002573 [Epithemia clementina (nom. ined.)]